MRSNRPATVQTTCDNEDCNAYAITAGLSATREERDDKHRRMLADDGWTDLEGRDYCPDHTIPPRHPLGCDCISCTYE